jgi:hypothetical protein
MDGDDLYGVFYAWNIWAVYADRLATEAATILGRAEEAKELEGIYQRGREDLLQSLQRGAITEADGTRWISAVPGKTTGSRYGVLNAAFPTRLLDPYDPLITGTLKYIEAHMSPGGIPIHTGWMKDGMWVAITLDNIAETHLVRDEGDMASKLLYATLNHGTPLYTWCEERGQEPNTKQASGDRQHLWTPVSVVRFVRDALVMEDGNTLHLARGIDRSWLESGKTLGIQNAQTHFGAISYNLTFDKASLKFAGSIQFPSNGTIETAVLHCRLPNGFRVAAVSNASGGVVGDDGATVVWNNPRGTVQLDARIAAAN